jgi:ATP-dependent DNA ligase
VYGKDSRWHVGEPDAKIDELRRLKSFPVELLSLALRTELGLEGIVSKRAGSRYKSGPSRNWLNAVR